MSKTYWFAQIGDSQLAESDGEYRVLLFPTEEVAIAAGAAEWGGTDYVFAVECVLVEESS